MRIGLGSLAAVLLLVMLYLFLGTPQVTFTGSDLVATCGSVASAGWPEDSFLDTPDVQHLADHVPSGLDATAVAGVVGDCDRQRTTFVGLMALLAVPTAVFGVLAARLPDKSRTGPRLREEVERGEE